MEAEALLERGRVVSLLRQHVVPALRELADVAALASAAPVPLRRAALAHASASGHWTIHRTPFGSFAQSEKFAEGFMAQTWRALDVRTGSVVLTKCFWLNDALSHKISFVLERLQRLHTLVHPNILPILGAHTEPDRLLIFMKLMHRGSLYELRTRVGEFSEDAARPFVRQVLVGLRYLHEHGYFHGAIKSSNVLLSDSGSVMLSDYALADSISEAFGRSSAIGPIYWTAPEVIEGKVALAEKQDVWSVACLVHELLTHGPPHSKLPPLRALFLSVKDPIPKISFVSAALTDFLARCFDKNPSHRPSIEELLSHPWINLKDPAPQLPLCFSDEFKAILCKARTRFIPSLQCVAVEDEPTWRCWSTLLFGNTLWLGGGNGVVTVRDTATRAVTTRIEVHKTRIYSLLNVLNRRIWCSSEDGGIYVINPIKSTMKRIAVHDDEHKLIKRMVHTDPEDKHGRIWSLAPANETSQLVALSKRGETKFQMTVKRFINTIEANPETQQVYLGCMGSVVVLDATTYETQHVIELGETPAAAATLKVSRILFSFGDITWLAAGNHLYVLFGDNKKPDKQFTLRAEIVNIAAVRDVLMCGDVHGGIECFSIRSCEHIQTLCQGPHPSVGAGNEFPIKCFCATPEAIWCGSYASNVLLCWHLAQQQLTKPSS